MASETTEKERKAIRFLVVDDHPMSRNLVKTVLFQAGFSTMKSAEDGLDARKVLESSEIDFIVCDWNMPRMSGLELLQFVRADARLSHIPFVMLTAQQEQYEVVTAFSEGVTDYVIKPFSPDVLLTKVEGHLKKHAILR